MRAQVYPKLFMSGGSMYETVWWGRLVRIWEVLVYNPLMDLEQSWRVRLRFPFSLHQL